MIPILPKSTFLAAYRLLDRVSPIPGNCGLLCNSACCMPMESCLSTCSLEDILVSSEDTTTPFQNLTESVEEAGTEALAQTFQKAMDEQAEALNKLSLWETDSLEEAWAEALDVATVDGAPDLEEDLLEEDDWAYEDEEPMDMGIYLYPGEEAVFSGQEDWIAFQVEDALDYEFPASWVGDIYFGHCLQAPGCDRKKRPLQCRFYPAAPHITADGSLILIYATEDTPYGCPLIDQEVALDPRFLKATYTVSQHLMRDPRIRDLFVFDSQQREDTAIQQLWPPL